MKNDIAEQNVMPSINIYFLHEKKLFDKMDNGHSSWKRNITKDTVVREKKTKGCAYLYLLRYNSFSIHFLKHYNRNIITNTITP